MSYLIQFADKTTKHVPNDVGAAIAQDLGIKRVPGVMVNGAYFSAHMISKVTPMHQWVEETAEAARREGKYMCKYGFTHPHSDRCTCKDAGLPMLSAEDGGHVFPALLKPQEVKQIEAPDAPPTEKEKAQMKAIHQAKLKFITKTSMPKVFSPDVGCPECNGKGELMMSGVLVTCVCVTNQKFTKPQ